MSKFLNAFEVNACNRWLQERGQSVNYAHGFQTREGKLYLGSDDYGEDAEEVQLPGFEMPDINLAAQEMVKTAIANHEEWLYGEGTSARYWGMPVVDCALAHLKDGTFPKTRKTDLW